MLNDGLRSKGQWISEPRLESTLPDMHSAWRGPEETPQHRVRPDFLQAEMYGAEM